VNEGEHQIMARVERTHWWYQGLRGALRCCIERLGPPLPTHPKLLDAGCGTGENLRFLTDLLEPSYAGGFDLSATGLEYTRARNEDADVYESDLCHPEIHQDGLDLILSADVVYIPGAERAAEGLAALTRHLAPGGRLILHLPALDWLYSEHDIAVHTSERYTIRRASRMLERAGLQLEFASYRMFLLFPLTVLARLPSMWRARYRRNPDARSELHDIPGALTNRVLGSILRIENRLLARGIPLPIGSSVIVVGRKVGRAR
jgi:SAM-dependent methyltransferase